MSNLLFGNFFLSSSGTKSISQKIVEKFQIENIDFIIGSKIKNKFFRILEISFKVLFYRYKNIHVDVFSDNAFNIAILVCLLNKVRNKKIILNLRGGKLIDFYHKKNNKYKVQFVLGSAQKIVSPSNFLVDFFNSNNFNVEYLPNYIDLKYFPYNKKLVRNNKILWVRGFHKMYNPKDAIYVLYHLINQIPDVSLTMIGPDKGIMNEVVNLIYELNLKEKVNIVGPVQNEKLYKYFHSHTVLINTTSYESFGQALLESAACGCPIVSNDVGEVSHIWQDEENILLSKLNDHKDMAEKLAILLSDSKLLEKLKYNAYCKSKKYHWKNLKNKWQSILS